MKSVLLIGGAGYVGTVLTSHFLKLGYKVTVLDNFIYNNQYSIQAFVGDPMYRFYFGDLNDSKALGKASEDITDVIILAGLVGDPITKKYPLESTLINEKGIQKCIDYYDRRPIEKLIFISSCSNYGLIGDNDVADEQFNLNPLSSYARAKVLNENYLLSKKGSVEYSGVVLRFATAFGLSPRMRFDLSISEFVRDIYFGESLVVYDENTWRPYCHVRDFANLLDLVLKSKKEEIDFEVFNAGGDINNYTKRMIISEILGQIPNGKVEFRTHGNDPRNYRVSFKKVNETLKFVPSFSVKDGIKELVEALKLGLFSDSITNKEKYGNYLVNYKSIQN